MTTASYDSKVGLHEAWVVGGSGGVVGAGERCGVKQRGAACAVHPPRAVPPHLRVQIRVVCYVGAHLCSAVHPPMPCCAMHPPVLCPPPPPPMRCCAVLPPPHLGVEICVVCNDLDGVLVGAHGAVGAHAPEQALKGALGEGAQVRAQLHAGCVGWGVVGGGYGGRGFAGDGAEFIRGGRGECETGGGGAV